MSNKHPSQAEIAHGLGITPGRVTHLKKKGMPLFSIEAARAWKAQHIAPTPGTKTERAQAAPEGTGAPDAMPATDRERPRTYESSRARREAAEADMAEMKMKELQRDLVRMDAVKAVWANAMSTTRDAILQIPSRVGPQLAAESDPIACSMLLETAIYEALTNLSNGEYSGGTA